MLVAAANAQPRPAVKANRLFAPLLGAGLPQGRLGLVERTAHAARSSRCRRILVPLQITIKIRPRDAVKLTETHGRQFASANQPVDELIGNAKHIGNIFKAHVLRDLRHFTLQFPFWQKYIRFIEVSLTYLQKKARTRCRAFLFILSLKQERNMLLRLIYKLPYT